MNLKPVSGRFAAIQKMTPDGQSFKAGSIATCVGVAYGALVGGISCTLFQKAATNIAARLTTSLTDPLLAGQSPQNLVDMAASGVGVALGGAAAVGAGSLAYHYVKKTDGTDDNHAAAKAATTAVMAIPTLDALVGGVTLVSDALSSFEPAASYAVAAVNLPSVVAMFVVAAGIAVVAGDTALRGVRELTRKPPHPQP